MLTLNLMDSSRQGKRRLEGEGATLGGFGKGMEPGLDWWGALRCFLGPLFSPHLLASTGNPLIIALLLWLKSWILLMLIHLEG